MEGQNFLCTLRAITSTLLLSKDPVCNPGYVDVVQSHKGSKVTVATQQAFSIPHSG